ncbi:unknown [Clostridium sp. CAG:768]|nr:unknown [Clostridium sp. CAG:768]
MKIQNIKSNYINFASSTNNTEQNLKLENTNRQKERKQKIIKYTLAATAAAAIVIGGLYYLGRHGGSGLKKTNLAEDVIPNSKSPKPETADINVSGIKNSNVDTVENVSNKQDLAEQVIKNDDKNISPEDNIIEDIAPERPKTKKSSRKSAAKTRENNMSLSKIPDSKKPFVLDKKYFDFSKIEGQRSENVVQQFENGILSKEFASNDGIHLNYYSEFDDTGNRIKDVEFRDSYAIKSIINYEEGKFLKASIFDKDGITIVKNFDNEEEYVRFSLDFE